MVITERQLISAVGIPGKSGDCQPLLMAITGVNKTKHHQNHKTNIVDVISRGYHSSTRWLCSVCLSNNLDMGSINSYSVLSRKKNYFNSENVN